MRIIAFYLPQFHNIPENDEWWGDGFTEWVNVKKAKPIYEGHEQPRVPLNNNYYNLLDDDVKIWQADLAKKYGVYGFCYYHYWFNGKLLLEKPMEQMLKNKKVDLPFCICWANEPWTRAWVGEKKVLIGQEYGEENEWKEHFEYLLPFFKDKRYIKENNCPLFVIYRPEIIRCLKDMLELWDKLAKENGFDGMCYAYQNLDYDLLKEKDDSLFDYNIEFQPHYAFFDLNADKHKYLRAAKRKLSQWLEKHTGKNLNSLGNGKLVNNTVQYDDAWNAILRRTPDSEKNVPGAFVGWDNTPRHGKSGRVYVGDTPEKFEKYLTEQIKRAKDVYNKDLMFLYAWNEWAEGGYLEPDERNGYRNLEAIKNALEATGEFPG